MMSDDPYRDGNGKFAATQAMRTTEAPPPAENAGGAAGSIPEPFEYPTTHDALFKYHNPGRPNKVSLPMPHAPEISPPDMMRGFADVMSNAGGPGSSGNESMPEPDPDWQAKRAMGTDGNPGEGAGDHQVLTPGGRAPHGAGVPGTGIPSPADDGSSQ